MITLPVVEQKTFRRYAGLSLPRHVAYPMPTWWEALSEADATGMRDRALRAAPERDLSLYVHVPFCEKLCLFCGCNRTIQRKNMGGAGGAGGAGGWADRTDHYIDAVLAEAALRAQQVAGAGRRPRVRQLHWGGGTPTYLDLAQIRHLQEGIAALFEITADAEVSIEIDPRVTTGEQLRLLRSLGFNRVSMGVQDFDRRVQEHVNRVQPYEMVERVTHAARDAGFTSVNFDLIYGLPYQSEASVENTVAKSIGLAPDRVAFYHYAQVPERIANQRGIDHEALPGSEAKLAMFLSAVAQFEGAGYDFIGLDHFAKKDELLARAKRDGAINRNFQGMTTGAQLDMIGLGNSAISVLPGVAYLQNEHDVKAYVENAERGDELVVRGMTLSRDDAIRQTAILELYCHGEIRPASVNSRINPPNGFDFGSYFERELEALAPLEADGLVTRDADGGVTLTFPLGRVLMRNVAAVFDAYLDENAARTGQRQAFSASA